EIAPEAATGVGGRGLRRGLRPMVVVGARGRGGGGEYCFELFDVICVRRYALDGRLDDPGAPAGTNAVVLRLGNEAGRGVHDLEPLLIRVPIAAGHSPCGLRGRLATHNDVAGKRLREGVSR